MRGEPIDSEKGPRPMCYSCFRPESHCLCQEINPIECHCNFLLLQHPNERRKYHSTARLLKRALPQTKILSGIRFSPEQIESTLANQKAYLLYPAKNAVGAESVDLDKNSSIIVIDGTWVEARKIIYRNSFLREVPTISFSTALRSNFVIRKQPRENCLSTIESVAHLLQINARAKIDEPTAARYEYLFQIFNLMVERQFAYFPRMRNTLPNEGKQHNEELSAF